MVKEGIWYTEKSHKELLKKVNELVTKCHGLEKENAELLEKIEKLEKRKNHFVELTNKYMDKHDDEFKKNDELVTKCNQLEKTIHDLEYQKHGIQCVLHDCFMTLLLNKIITPDMKFYKDIVKAKEC